MFAKQETCTCISMKLTCYRTLRSQHWKTVCVFHDKRTVLFLPIWPVRRHLVLNRCKGSRGSTDGWVGCQEECELYPSFVLACIFVCARAYFQHPRRLSCVFASQPSCGVCQQKSWISVSRVTMPAPKEPPDTQALRQPGHADSSSDSIP